MQSRFFLSSTLALSSLLFLWGCGSSSSSFEGKESTCKDFCAGVARCSSEADTSECEKSCTEDELVSRGGQEVITECFADLSCDASNPLGSVGCLLEGIKDLPQSGEAKKFCQEGLPALSECGEDEAPSSAECLDFIPLFADETLEELNECLISDRNCDSKQRCVALTILPKLDLDSLEDPQPSSGSLIGLLVLLLGGDGLSDVFPGQTPDDDEPPFSDGGSAGAPGE